MAGTRDDEVDVWPDINVSHIDVSDIDVSDIDVSEDLPGDDLAEDLDLLDAELDDGPRDDEQPDSSGRPRRLRWYILTGGVAVMLLLVGVFGPSWWQVMTQRRASLATPQHLAGLTLDTSADGKATADYLRTAVAASVSLNTSVGAVYDDPGDKQRSVMFFGGTGLLLSPDKELNSAFRLLDDRSGDVTDVHPVPAGRLGGEMKCGTSTGDGGDMPVCGWADHGSLALALFPGRSMDDAAALMRQIREDIQHRN